MVFNISCVARFKKVMLIAAFIMVGEFAFPHAGMASVFGASDHPDRSFVSIGIVLKPVPSAEAAWLEEQERKSISASDVTSRLPDISERAIKRTVRVTLTAYASVPELTDGDPFTMADGKQVFDGAIATNLLPFGTLVRFPEIFGDKLFAVHDRMNARYNGKYILDIWHPSREAAIAFGAKYNIVMEVLE